MSNYYCLTWLSIHLVTVNFLSSEPDKIRSPERFHWIVLTHPINMKVLLYANSYLTLSVTRNKLPAWTANVLNKDKCWTVHWLSVDKESHYNSDYFILSFSLFLNQKLICRVESGLVLLPVTALWRSRRVSRLNWELNIDRNMVEIIHFLRIHN